MRSQRTPLRHAHLFIHTPKAIAERLRAVEAPVAELRSALLAAEERAADAELRLAAILFLLLNILRYFCIATTLLLVYGTVFP